MLNIEEITDITTRFRACREYDKIVRQNALDTYLYMSGGKPYKRKKIDILRSWIGQRFLAVAHWLGEYD